MDIREAILESRSRTNMLRIAQYIGNDTERFAELIDLFLTDTKRVRELAGWVMSHCIDHDPTLILPHLGALLDNLQQPDLHDAIKRNTVRVLQFIDIPEEHLGTAATICFDYMQSVNEAVAIRAFAMMVAFNICQKVPELKNELKMVVEEMMPYGSAAIRSRGRKILKKL